MPYSIRGSESVSIQVHFVSYQCQHGHNFLIDQSKINGHDLVSYQYRSEARNYQCQTNRHDISSFFSTSKSYQCQQGHKFLIY